MSRYAVTFYILLAFAILNTLLLALQLLNIPVAPLPNFTNESEPAHPVSSSPITLPLSALQVHSIVLVPVSWGAVAGAWIWRGRTKSEWTRRGLDQNLFKLLLQMRGSTSRTAILKALLMPKDRLQLAKTLDLDWATIDYHIQVLIECELVREKTAHGNLVLYELTPLGDKLLNALDEMSKK